MVRQGRPQGAQVLKGIGSGPGITRVILKFMKTAISLPEDLFRQAEAAARKLRVSRSQLYAAAIREFLDRREPSKVTAHLDEIYSKQPAKIDPVMYLAQLESLKNGTW